MTGSRIRQPLSHVVARDLPGTVVFSVLYFVFFHIAPAAGTNGWTLDEAYEENVAENLKLQFRDLGDLQVDEATVLKYMQNRSGWPLDVGLQDALQVVPRRQRQRPGGAESDGRQLQNVKQLIDVARVIENGAATAACPLGRIACIPTKW